MKKTKTTTKKKTKKKVSKIGYYSGTPTKDDAAVKASGLNKIDDDLYDLIKLGAKKSSSLGYADKFIAIQRAEIKIVTTEGVAFVVGLHLYNWFKTSPVLKTTKKGKDYLLETENSFYQLKRV